MMLFCVWCVDAYQSQVFRRLEVLKFNLPLMSLLGNLQCLLEFFRCLSIALVLLLCCADVCACLSVVVDLLAELEFLQLAQLLN
jgi:hypothetical protein